MVKCTTHVEAYQCRCYLCRTLLSASIDFLLKEGILGIIYKEASGTFIGRAMTSTAKSKEKNQPGHFEQLLNLHLIHFLKCVSFLVNRIALPQSAQTFSQGLTIGPLFVWTRDQINSRSHRARPWLIAARVFLFFRRALEEPDQTGNCYDNLLVATPQQHGITVGTTPMPQYSYPHNHNPLCSGSSTPLCSCSSKPRCSFFLSYKPGGSFFHLPGPGGIYNRLLQINRTNHPRSYFELESYSTGITFYQRKESSVDPLTDVLLTGRASLAHPGLDSLKSIKQ